MSRMPDFEALASDTLNEATDQLGDISGLPVPVRDAVDAAKKAISDMALVSGNIETELAKLDEEKDLTPLTGWTRVRGATLDEAPDQLREARP